MKIDAMTLAILARRAAYVVLSLVAIGPSVSLAVTLVPGDILVAANFSNNPFLGGAIVVVDPTTGDRTILSDGTHGTGPGLQGATSISFASDGSLLVGAFGAQTLYRVDPTTGNRSIISSASVGTGPTSSYDGAVQFGNQLVLSGGAPLYVDPSSGNRTAVPGGTGLASVGLAVSGSNLIIGNTAANDIVKLDTTTGIQTIISGGGVGSGPAISHPSGLEFDGTGNLLLEHVPSPFLDGEILRIDPLTGNRTIVSGGGVGTGLPFGNTGSQLAVEPNGTILAISPLQLSVLQIDPTTGNRTALSGPTAGTGPQWLGLGSACAVVPAPEPSSLILAALGVLLLLANRRRT
jgi:MYXO-CTERM domain-containing protein